MDQRSGWIFVQVNNVLVDVLHDELISIFRHPSVNKTGFPIKFELVMDERSCRSWLKLLRRKIQERIPVEGSFVMKELVGRLRMNARARHNILGDIGSVLVAPPRAMDSMTRSSTGMFPVGMIPRVGDDISWVNCDEYSAQSLSKAMMMLTVAR